MFGIFRSQPAVQAAITNLHNALAAVESEVSKEESVVADTEKKVAAEVDSHAAIVAVIESEYKSKVENETTRFNTVKGALDSDIETRKTTISQGKTFAARVRSALFAVEDESE